MSCFGCLSVVCSLGELRQQSQCAVVSCDRRLCYSINGCPLWSHPLWSHPLWSVHQWVSPLVASPLWSLWSFRLPSMGVPFGHQWVSPLVGVPFGCPLWSGIPPNQWVSPLGLPLGALSVWGSGCCLLTASLFRRFLAPVGHDGALHVGSQEN